MKKTRKIIILIGLFGLIGLCLDAFGQVTYKSIADGDFLDPSRWTPAGIPGPSDDVIIYHDINLSGSVAINSLTIENVKGVTSSLNLWAGADMTVAGDVGVTMHPFIPKYAKITIMDGASLHVAGSMNYLRDNESQFECGFIMNGGFAEVAGNFTFNYLTGGYHDATGDYPENFTEVDLQGNAFFDVKGKFQLYQKESSSLTTFQYILQVRTQNSAKLQVNSMWLENITNVSQYLPQLHIELWHDSQVLISNNLTLNQTGNASDLVRFESEGNSSFSVGGDITINKQNGRTVLLELYDNSTGSANNVFITKTGGSSNIAIRAKNSSTFTLNGSAGLSEINNGGVGSFGFDVEPGASVLIPNGGIDILTGSSGGPTYINIDGNLQAGFDWSIETHAKLMTLNIRGNVGLGGNMDIRSYDDTSDNSGVFATGTLSANNLFFVQNRVFNSRTFFLNFDGAFSGTISGNVSVDNQKGTCNFLTGSLGAGTGTMEIGGDLLIKNSASASTSSLVTEFHGSTQLIVRGSTTLSNTNSFLTINRNHLSFFDDAVFIAAGLFTVESHNISNVNCDFYNNSKLRLESDISRPFNYGKFYFHDLASIEFNGSGSQIMPATKLIDDFIYNIAIINNTASSIPQLTLEGDVEINNSMIFVNGIVQTDGSKKVIFKDNTVATGASNESFIDGPVYKQGVRDFEFPTGDFDGSVSKWAPVAVAGIIGGDANLIISGEYFMSMPPNPTSLNPEIDHISNVEFWEFGPLTAHVIEADVTIFWKDAVFSGITDITSTPQDLIFAHYATPVWENLLGAINPGSTIGGGGSGDITAHMTSFSPITFGTQFGNSPLPVSLKDFNGTLQGSQITLIWITESEVDNNFFEVEKSIDGEQFKKIAVVPGNGTTSIMHQYTVKDKAATGNNYYRLKQTDNSGRFAYSKVILVEYQELFTQVPVVFPNPVSQSDTPVVTIGLNPDIAEVGSDIQISLIGPAGNIIVKRTVKYSGESIALDLSGQNLSKGVNILVVNSGFRKFQSKLLIE